MNGEVIEPDGPPIGTRGVKLVAGLFIILLGLVLTLQNLRVARAGELLEYWPLFLIAIGGLKLRDGRRSGLVWAGVGALLLALNAGFIHVSLFDLWPLALIAGGIVIVIRATGLRLPVSSAPDGEAIWGVFAQRKVTIDPSAVRRRRVVALFAAVEIEIGDAADLASPLVIDATAICGAVLLRVPRGWDVVGEAVPVMGGIEIKTAPGESSKQLIVRGLALMGGMEITNVRTV